MFVQKTVFFLSALGLLLSTAPVAAAPTSTTAVAEPATLAARAVPTANSDIGLDMLYAILKQQFGGEITQEVITKMVDNEDVVVTEPMKRYIAEARVAVAAGDQKAAYKAMRKWSIEVDKALGLRGKARGA